MAGLFDIDADAFLTQEREKVAADFLNPRDYRTTENPFRMLGGAFKTYNLQNSDAVKQMRDTETIMKQIDDLDDPMQLGVAQKELMKIGNVKGAYQIQQMINALPQPAKLDTSVQEIDGKKVLIDNQSGSTIKNLGPVTGQGEDDTAGPEEEWFDDNNVLIGIKQKDKTGRYHYTRYKQSPLVQMGTKEKVTFALAEFKVANEAARAGQNQINNLDYIDQTMAGIKTGSLTDWRVAIGRLSSSLNLPIEGDLNNLESAKTAMGNLVMASLNNFPGQISNQERQFLEGIMPSLTQTPEGRASISKMLRKIANRSLVKRDMMQKYVRGGSPDLTPEEGTTFYDEWAKYQNENPLFDNPNIGTGTKAKNADGVQIELYLDGSWRLPNGDIYGAEK